tara:strand:- start:2247 stop:3743 length:1497 start_codon:yes stop_codon:yes gene_type:complete
MNNSIKINKSIINIYPLIIIALGFTGCSSPEYVKIVTEKMDGTRVGLAPEIIVSYLISEEGYRPLKYQDFHSNGNTHLIGNFSSNVVEPIRIGTWNQYHLDGKIFATGSYEGNVKKNKWKYYHENGELAAQGLYQNNQQSKKWKYYYNDGKKEQIQNFDVQGVLNGEYNVWYSNGNKHIDGYYSNGNRDSLWKAYDGSKEDLLYYEVIYDNSTIKNYTVYYQNGGKLAEGGTYGYIEKNGSYKLWYENGNQAYEESFSNGKRNGNAKYWDLDGELNHSETLNDSIYSRVSGDRKIIKTYNEDLSKLLKVDYSYNLTTDSNSVFKGQNLLVSATVNSTTRYKEGKWNAKYSSGTTAGKIEYNNGDRTGDWQIYYPNGKLASKLKYSSKGSLEEVIDINGYKWVVTNGYVSCPNGKRIQVSYLFDSDCDCRDEDCSDRNTIKSNDLKDIDKDWNSIDNSMDKANNEFIASFNYNLDSPNPRNYDIAEPILGIRLPFKIKD